MPLAFVPHSSRIPQPYINTPCPFLFHKPYRMTPEHVHPLPSGASSITPVHISVPLEVIPPPPAQDPMILEILQQNQQIMKIVGTTLQSLTPAKPLATLSQQASSANRNSLSEDLIDIKTCQNCKPM